MSVISFTKVKLPYGWLGNMSAFPVTHLGKSWCTTEALFQALRFNDEMIQEAIRAEKSPMSAKLVAKTNADKMVVEPTSTVDLQNMELVLRLKLDQHPHLKSELLNTDDSVIIEDVTNRSRGGRHQFWGAALKDGEWVGENALGKIWMKLRTELKGA